MTTNPDPPTGGVSPRIGSAERQQAMDALDVHLSAGRLDPDEYGERVGRVSVARTMADLEPLFVDLPAPRPTTSGFSPPPPVWSPPGSAGRYSPAPNSGGGAAADPSRAARRDRRRGGQPHHGREPLGGRAGEVVVAASPFIAVLLFFLVHSSNSWLFFLLIPLAGAVIYGRNWSDD